MKLNGVVDRRTLATSLSFEFLKTTVMTGFISFSHCEIYFELAGQIFL